MGNEVILERQVLDLEQGSHLCLIYERDPLEQMPALIPFIKQALEGNEQFIYIADDIPVEHLSLILKINGIDVEAQGSRGALKLWTRTEWRQPGELDPRKKSVQIHGFIDHALRAGFNGVRFAVEMTWTLGPDISAEKLEHWEATINTIFTPGFPGRIICQYSRHKLPASVINQAFRTHPHVIIDNSLCPNSFYEAPIIVDDRSRAPTEWMISQVKKDYLKEKAKSVGGRAIDYKNLEWGTHVCNFYRTRADLVELLVPYFKGGLEGNEMCMWLTSEPLNSQEAKEALSKAVPDLDTYIRRGQIQVIDADSWYLQGQKLRPSEEVLSGWIAKEQEALKKGFRGLRLAADTYRVEQKGWDEFRGYESAVNSSIHRHKIIALCSYPLEKCSPPDIAEAVSSHQCTFIKKDGEVRAVESSEQNRAETLLLEACRELECRVKQRTVELSKSLEEKEALLKEIHHRVKNNMQVVSSLIRLQSAKLEDKEAAKVLEECQNRIKSMALVHEALYRSNDFTTLNLSDYINSLGNELLRSYNLNPEKIKMDVDIKDVILDMDTAIACGLILNELITNSIKYAFSDRRDGRIKVNLSVSDNRAKLFVSDDGIGLPKDFDTNSSKTLGMRLVKMLAAQLEGRLKINNGCGTSFEIEFPIMKVV